MRKLNTAAETTTRTRIDDDFKQAMHYIAQGAINIAEGIDTPPPHMPETVVGCYIEAGSPIHRAMETLCKLVNDGRVSFDGKATR